MAEESNDRKITPQDLQTATRLAAVEVHIHHIKETTERLEQAQNMQAAVINAMSDSSKRTEIMLTTLAANLTAQKETISAFAPIRDKVLQWSGSLGFIAAMIAFILWFLNRYFPVK